MIKIIRYTNGNALEVTWFDENDEPIKCNIYSNTQMNLLRVDLGDDAKNYEDLITEMESISDPDPIHVVPETCTPAQGLISLFIQKQVTHEHLIELIDGIEDPVVKYTTHIGFTRATEWRRSSPSIALLGQLLNLSEDDLDELFTFAVTVEV